MGLEAYMSLICDIIRRFEKNAKRRPVNAVCVATLDDSTYNKYCTRASCQALFTKKSKNWRKSCGRVRDDPIARR